MADIIAAISTGKQPCAIGILRLSGEGCAEVVERVFRCKSGKPLTEAPDRKLVLGTLFDVNGREIDQALAVFTRGPQTYTGEDTAELQCHGSPAVLAAGLEALYRAGARPARPGEPLPLSGTESRLTHLPAQPSKQDSSSREISVCLLSPENI